MRIQSIIPLPLALIVAAGCGVPTAATDESHQAIEGGTADTGHPYVGLLWRPDNREGCTGTLITPQIVMTAAHCFNGINTGGGMPVFYTGQGIGGVRTNDPNTDWDPSRDPTLTAHTVQTWTIANGFVDGCPNKNDLALVLLSTGIYKTYFGSYAHAGYPLPGAPRRRLRPPQRLGRLQVLRRREHRGDRRDRHPGRMGNRRQQGLRRQRRLGRAAHL
jgi:hypothetical protein